MNVWLARFALAVAALSIATAGIAREPWIDYAWLVKVKPGGKRFIYSHGVARPGCDEAEPCLTKAYVIGGDLLVASDIGTLGKGSTKWVEVEYVSRSGRSTFGWVRDADLEPLADPPAAIGAWTGNWQRTEADIQMKPGRRVGTVSVTGEATWGASDPDRVRRGGVHIGEIEGTFQPVQSRGGFAMGETGSLPFDKGEEFDCRVRFRLLLPYLLVEDNGNCGGANVSFLGTYVRQGR
ncbi:MAG: hypothetical protein KGZ65_08425 [Sphingomonadales bacterium]|nr:hypothetical protein [Sphingomonadaceae bacterium]MBS3931246.1 hypothetical protein [Sphingomonadales bacterium]